jgi:hypothetical protein
MGAFIVVVPDIFPEHSLEMTFPQDENVVQALLPYGEGYVNSNPCSNSVIFIDQPAQPGNPTSPSRSAPGFDSGVDRAILDCVFPPQFGDHYHTIVFPGHGPRGRLYIEWLHSSRPKV